MDDASIPDGFTTNAHCLPNLAPSIYAGLAQLLRAFDYAVELESDVWDFAVEISDLRAAGMTTSDLRWLITKGLASHAEETSIYGARHRTFRAAEGLMFLATTAFVLTCEGAEVVRTFLAGQAAALSPAERPLTFESRSSATGIRIVRSLDGKSADQSAAPDSFLPIIKPVWESRRRELRVAEILVKQFRVPADNQERVLAAFEEESWPAVIDDPLPRSAKIVPKRRLHNVITRLNGGQIVPLLHFRGNGSGEGVGWELLSAQEGNKDSHSAAS